MILLARDWTVGIWLYVWMWELIGLDVLKFVVLPCDLSFEV